MAWTEGDALFHHIGWASMESNGPCVVCIFFFVLKLSQFHIAFEIPHLYRVWFRQTD